MSLARKLSLVLALVLATAVGASIVLTLRTSRTYLEEVEQRLNRELADHLVAEEPLLQDGKVDPEALEHLFHMLMVINPRIELYVLDPGGRILAYEAPKGRVDLETVALRPVERFLAGEREPLHGDDPRDPQTPKIFSAAPMKSAAGDLQGYLYVVLTGEQYRSLSDRFAESVALRVGIWAALAIAVFVLLAGVGVFHFLTRPLQRLDRRIAGFRSEQLEGLPATSGGDEVARLEASFDAMALRIAEQVAELEKTDLLRRELVANVSHDLRTPVASLQGYLETLLLKGDRVSASERLAYLEVAHSQSERLGRLVGELFELARLDSGDTAVILEEVSVAELSQDVVQKLEVLARNRQVALVARIDPEAPPVNADVRLLERILENLITNALQHTPAGGRVEVTVRPEDDGARVTVEDSGCGIAEQDIPRIFDRTFRSDVSRSEGAGLGLAIAQRAVELHSSRIDVSSTVGQGTTFSFGLPS